MKPAPFEYLAPDSLDAALEALAGSGGDAKLLAGGQSLIPVMNFRLAQPTFLVDLNRVRELDYVREADGGLRRRFAGTYRRLAGAYRRLAGAYRRSADTSRRFACTLRRFAGTYPCLAGAYRRLPGTCR